MSVFSVVLTVFSGCMEAYVPHSVSVAFPPEIEKAEADLVSGRYAATLMLMHDLVERERSKGKQQDVAVCALAYEKMGRAFLAGGDPHSALRNFGHAKEYALEARCDSVIMYASLYVSVTAASVGDTVTASDAVAGLKRFVEDESRSDSDGNALLAIAEGVFESRFGSARKAETMLRDADTRAEECRLPVSIRAIPLFESATLYEQRMRFDSASVCLRKIYTLGVSLDGLPLRVRALENLVRVYSRRGDPGAADECGRELAVIADSLPDRSEFLWAVSRLDAEQERKTSERIRSLASERWFYKICFIAVISVLGAGLLYLFVRSRVRRSSSEEKSVESAVVVAECTPDETCTADNASSDIDKTCSPSAEALFEKIEAVVSDEENYSDPDFNLTRLAYLCGSNIHYVSAAINECAGVNFRTFLNTFRVEEARRRITDEESFGNLTIQYIAKSTGFRSQTSFIRVFKERFGFTPSLYQKIFGGKRSTPPIYKSLNYSLLNISYF